MVVLLRLSRLVSPSKLRQFLKTVKTSEKAITFPWLYPDLKTLLEGTRDVRELVGEVLGVKPHFSLYCEVTALFAARIMLLAIGDLFKRSKMSTVKRMVLRWVRYVSYYSATASAIALALDEMRYRLMFERTTKFPKAESLMSVVLSPFLNMLYALRYLLKYRKLTFEIVKNVARGFNTMLHR